MKTYHSNLSKIGIGVLLLGAMSWMPVSAQVTGIANTPHNLTSTGPVNQFTPTTGTAEICVFCHTPHGSDTTAAIPLWNRVSNAPGTYTTYDALGTVTLDGNVDMAGSVSLACLSCHDGVQAMNTVINQPGSGGVNTAGAAIPGSWTGTNVTVGGQIAGGIALIGTDLQNDHPIGIEYAGGGLSASAGTATQAGTATDPDFFAPDITVQNSTTLWWLDVDTDGTRDKDDILLYTRTTAGTSTPWVECASCHDPHSDTNATFLRTANTGSAVCLACHNK